MDKRCKVRVKRFSAFSAFAILFIITFHVNAGFHHANAFHLPKAENDTPPPKKLILKDSIKTRLVPGSDSSKTAIDSAGKDSVVQKIDSFKLSKDSLDAPVNYSAEDSGVLIIPTKEFILYGKAKAKYTDIEVTANTIELNQDRQMLKAYGSIVIINFQLSTDNKLSIGNCQRASLLFVVSCIVASLLIVERC